MAEVVDIIDILDEEPDDWPKAGPQNPMEAKGYMDKIDDIMKTFSILLEDDRKDAIRLMVILLKKLMAKHWSPGRCQCSYEGST